MNYKLCELYNKNLLSKYEQNTHFIQTSPCFRYSFHCFGMLPVRENEISLRNSSGGPEYLRILDGILLTMQCKWMFTNSLSFLHYKENAPCYGNNHKKTLCWRQ